jgi:hypothetical protein
MDELSIDEMLQTVGQYVDVKWDAHAQAHVARSGDRMLTICPPAGQRPLDVRVRRRVSPRRGGRDYYRLVHDASVGRGSVDRYQYHLALRVLLGGERSEPYDHVHGQLHVTLTCSWLRTTMVVEAEVSVDSDYSGHRCRRVY